MDDSRPARGSDAPALPDEGQAPPVEGPAAPTLYRWVTVAYSVVVAGLFAFFLLAASTPSPLERLEQPGETVNLVMGRALDHEAFFDTLAPEPRALQLLGTSPPSAVDQAVEAYYALWELTGDPRWSRTLAILEAERGHQLEASAWLGSLLDPGAPDAPFIAAVSRAYDLRPVTSVPPTRVWALTLEPAWARDTLLMRLDQKLGDAESANAARARILERGAAVAQRDGGITAAWLTLLAVGVAGATLWASRVVQLPRLADGVTVGPWGWGRAYAVMVRALVYGGILSAVAILLSHWTPPFVALLSLAGGLPLFWLGNRLLLRPHGLSLATAFGLNVPRQRWGALILLAIVLAGVDLAGGLATGILTSRTGIASPWSEGIDEVVLQAPWPIAGLQVLNGIVGAPLVEEIAFRGFTYVTLRSRLGVGPAGLLTALLFGAVHLYSLPGFLAVAWSGFVWAIAYERTRSLLPTMLSHGLYNALSYFAIISTYRL